MSVCNFKIEFAPGVTQTEIDGKHVLFSKNSGDFFGLNDSAQMFLKELQCNDFLTTLNKAAESFSMPEEEIANDILMLLKNLEAPKFIHKIPVP